MNSFSKAPDAQILALLAVDSHLQRLRGVTTKLVRVVVE